MVLIADAVWFDELPGCSRELPLGLGPQLTTVAIDLIEEAPQDTRALIPIGLWCEFCRQSGRYDC